MKKAEEISYKKRNQDLLPKPYQWVETGAEKMGILFVKLNWHFIFQYVFARFGELFLTREALV